MINKKITFCATRKDMLEVWPHPKPANRFVEDAYKKLERFENKNLHNATVKTCLPFLDSMTAGYIIPFDQDYLVDPVETDFTIVPANREQSDFGFHNQAQLSEAWKKIAGENAGKFHNKWLIKTPPGYSCLFVKPMNRIEERFEVISGIVDTDTYINTINFPFILRKRDEQFLIKKGEPMVQVIPFKRESWKMKISGEKTEPFVKRKLLYMTKIIHIYKDKFWSKKSWK